MESKTETKCIKCGKKKSNSVWKPNFICRECTRKYHEEIKRISDKKT